MMRSTAAAFALFLAGCTAATEQWRPAPVSGAQEPAEVIAASAAADWQPIPDEDLLVMDLEDGGRIVIQLAPHFAPVHVANVRAFARGGWWNGATIYRVQDNYVAQWGNGDAQVALPAGVTRTPPAEYERPTAGLHRPTPMPHRLATPAAGWSPTTRARAWPGCRIAMPASASAAIWPPTRGQAASSMR
jgi:peptidylprolyl isomerase